MFPHATFTVQVRAATAFAEYGGNENLVPCQLHKRMQPSQFERRGSPRLCLTVLRSMGYASRETCALDRRKRRPSCLKE